MEYNKIKALNSQCKSKLKTVHNQYFLPFAVSKKFQRQLLFFKLTTQFFNLFRLPNNSIILYRLSKTCATKTYWNYTNYRSRTKGRSSGRIPHVIELVKGQTAVQKPAKRIRLVSWEFVVYVESALRFSYKFRTRPNSRYLFCFAERIASPVPSNADNSEPMMVTTSNVSIALANAISTNQTNSSASKAKIPPLKLRPSVDCDNSSVTGEPSSAELMVRCVSHCLNRRFHIVEFSKGEKQAVLWNL